MAAVSLTLAERRERQQRHDAERAEHLAGREHLLAPRQSNAELEEIARAAEARFDRPDTTSAEVLAWVADTFGGGRGGRAAAIDWQQLEVDLCRADAMLLCGVTHLTDARLAAYIRGANLMRKGYKMYAAVHTQVHT